MSRSSSSSAVPNSKGSGKGKQDKKNPEIPGGGISAVVTSSFRAAPDSANVVATQHEQRLLFLLL